MGCTNLLTLQAVAVAMAALKEDSLAQLVPGILGAIDTIDWGKAGVEITRATGSAAGLAAFRSDYGGLAEDIVTQHFAEQGMYPVHIHESANEKGIDCVYFNPETDEIFAVEVKSTLDPDRHSPHLSMTKDGRQAGAGWTDPRLAASGLEHATWKDVETRVFHVNLATGQACEYRVDSGGQLSPEGAPFDIKDV